MQNEDFFITRAMSSGKIASPTLTKDICCKKLCSLGNRCKYFQMDSNTICIKRTIHTPSTSIYRTRQKIRQNRLLILSFKIPFPKSIFFHAILSHGHHFDISATRLFTIFVLSVMSKGEVGRYPQYFPLLIV